MENVVMSVHFLRNENEGDDDCVRVGKQDSLFYVETFLCMNTPNSARLHTVTAMTPHCVTRYLQDVFALVALDSIPFDSVQFNSPIVPSVVFDLNTGAFEKARDVIVRLVDTTLSCWPDLAVAKADKKRRRGR